MFFKESAERTMLYARIDALERRLALLEEEQVRETPPDEGTTVHDRRDAGEMRFGRRGTDRRIIMSKEQEADAGREAARMVALEMLSAGYRPEQVTTYLHQTFGFGDADANAVLASTDLSPN
ncbi:MAG: hypothetical protein ACR2FZ_05675 [Thermoleophilaceae bacterium]